MFNFLNKFKCIAIAGNNGVGKTSLTRQLSSDRDTLSFAHDLRAIASVVLDIESEDLKTLEVKESVTPMFPDYSVRDVMINLATCIRSMNDNYFVTKTLSSATGKIIIDDLRFMTEVMGLNKKYLPEEIVFILLKKEGEEYTGEIPSGHFDMVITRNGNDYYIEETLIENL